MYYTIFKIYYDILCIYIYFYIYDICMYLYMVPPNRCISFYSVFITPTSLMEGSMSSLQIKTKKSHPSKPYKSLQLATCKDPTFGLRGPIFADFWELKHLWGMGISYELPCFATKTPWKNEGFWPPKNTRLFTINTSNKCRFWGIGWTQLGSG